MAEPKERIRDISKFSMSTSVYWQSGVYRAVGRLCAGALRYDMNRAHPGPHVQCRYF